MFDLVSIFPEFLDHPELHPTLVLAFGRVLKRAKLDRGAIRSTEDGTPYAHHGLVLDLGLLGIPEALAIQYLTILVQAREVFEYRTGVPAPPLAALWLSPPWEWPRWLDEWDSLLCRWLAELRTRKADRHLDAGTKARRRASDARSRERDRLAGALAATRATEAGAAWEQSVLLRPLPTIEEIVTGLLQYQQALPTVRETIERYTPTWGGLPRGSFRDQLRAAAEVRWPMLHSEFSSGDSQVDAERRQEAVRRLKAAIATIVASETK